MKQLLTILLLFPLFIACSSDDDNDSNIDPQLVGEWIEPTNGWILKITDNRLDGNFTSYFDHGSFLYSYIKNGKIVKQSGETVDYKVDGNVLTLNTKTGVVTLNRVE